MKGRIGSKMLMLAASVAAAAAFIAPTAADATTPGGRNLIAFVGVGNSNWSHIFTVHPDGTGAVDLMPLANYANDDPAWSPDGQTIAFSSYTSGISRDIWLMGSDGSNPVQLTTDGSQEIRPSWSPDGSRIALEADSRIVTISAVDGSDRVDIGRGDAPTYSPDGTQIVFARYRNGQSDIMVMNADGSNVVDLTKTTDVSEFLPDWSPDGSTIVFQRSMGNHEIFTMKPDGSSEYRITKNTVYDAYPSFSPDGTSLLMIHNDRIYTMDASGGSAFAVIGDPTDMGTYSTDWQPLPCTMTGTSGDDELIGTTGDDVICGDDGSDIIDGLGGNDTLLAGAGNDTLYGREGSDILAGGEGTDLLIGGDGKDRLAGDLEKDVMRAGAGDDYLFAWDRAGGDRLVCGTGTDRWAAESTDTVRC